jgi:hypothetical protein
VVVDSVVVVVGSVVVVVDSVVVVVDSVVVEVDSVVVVVDSVVVVVDSVVVLVVGGSAVVVVVVLASVVVVGSVVVVVVSAVVVVVVASVVLVLVSQVVVVVVVLLVSQVVVVSAAVVVVVVDDGSVALVVVVAALVVVVVAFIVVAVACVVVVAVVVVVDGRGTHPQPVHCWPSGQSLAASHCSRRPASSRPSPQPCERRALNGCVRLPSLSVPESESQLVVNVALSFAFPLTPLQLTLLLRRVPFAEPLSFAAPGPQIAPMVSWRLASMTMASLTGEPERVTSAASGMNRPPSHGSTLAPAAVALAASMARAAGTSAIRRRNMRETSLAKRGPGCVTA